MCYWWLVQLDNMHFRLANMIVIIIIVVLSNGRNHNESNSAFFHLNIQFNKCFSGWFSFYINLYCQTEKCQSLVSSTVLVPNDQAADFFLVIR